MSPGDCPKPSLYTMEKPTTVRLQLLGVLASFGLSLIPLVPNPGMNREIGMNRPPLEHSGCFFVGPMRALVLVFSSIRSAVWVWRLCPVITIIFSTLMSHSLFHVCFFKSVRYLTT